MVGVLQRQFQNVYDNGRDITQLYLYFECSSVCWKHKAQL